MTTRWTWLVYMATDNDAATVGWESVLNMCRAQRGDSVRVLVQQDTPQGCARWNVAAQPEKLADLGSADSGDPNTLLEFVKWGIATAPADHYALVLWSHGTGWKPKKGDEASTALNMGSEHRQRSSGASSDVFFSTTRQRLQQRPTPADRAIASDDGTGHALDTIELGNVMAEASRALGRPLDLLAMNACQMATVEVAYQVREHVGVYIASEENMPVAGLPYDKILSLLGAQPALETMELARQIVEHYCGFFKAATDYTWGQDGLPLGATLTALNLGRVESLVQSVQHLAAVLRADLTNQYDAVWEAFSKAYPFPYNTNPDFRPTLYDMLSFARALSASPKASADVRAAADALIAAFGDPAMLARGATADAFGPLGGLTTFVRQSNADGNNQISQDYARTAYAQATGWGDLLADWLALSVSA